jgi:hypothetical protein
MKVSKLKVQGNKLTLTERDNYIGVVFDEFPETEITWNDDSKCWMVHLQGVDAPLMLMGTCDRSKLVDCFHAIKWWIDTNGADKCKAHNMSPNAWFDVAESVHATYDEEYD